MTRLNPCEKKLKTTNIFDVKVFFFSFYFASKSIDDTLESLRMNFCVFQPRPSLSYMQVFF